MNEREFLDLLRYYFRSVKSEDVEEILTDYKAHFAEARERGLTDEQITKELGHPEDIYQSYQAEGIVSEKGKIEKISEQAEILADKTQKKAADTWNELSPKIPDAANVTASILVKIFYAICAVIAILVFGITALIIYLLSIHFTPIMGAAPLPGLHPITLIGLAGTGIFAALSIYFMGALGKDLYKSRKREENKNTPSSDNPAGNIASEITDVLPANTEKGGEQK